MLSGNGQKFLDIEYGEMKNTRGDIYCADVLVSISLCNTCRHEAMSDLIYLLSQLVDLKGNIIIPDINNDVAPLTDDERATYTDIDFDKVSK